VRRGRLVRRGRTVVLAVLLAGAATAVGGCDGSTSQGVVRLSAGRLLVYASLPQIGPQREIGRAVLRGARLALAAVHGRVGRYTVTLHALNDATVASHGWDPGQTTANATLAAKDTRTIGYLGDLNSGASAVSIPILNRADIPQISPLSTAVGLTRGGPEASPGEPEKYYPAMRRTFARVVPNDRVQSAVQVSLQQQDGCRRVYLLYDGEVDGRDAADSFQAAATSAHLQVLGFNQFDPTAKSYVSLGAKLAKLDPDCVLISALMQDHAVAVTDAVARALPHAALFITSALGEPAFVDPARGGVQERFDPRLTITYPTLAPADYPAAGRRFLARFDRTYGSGAMFGIWGEAAMSLMLDAIRRAGDGGRRDVTRSRVLHEIFATRDHASVLGTYSVDASGDTSLSRYGVYHVADGHLVFWGAMRG
jgi:branched-chain amino acid transport system substrate-binding protein